MWQAIVISFAAAAEVFDPECHTHIGPRHLGFHPRNLRAFMGNSLFPGFFERALSRLNDAALQMRAHSGMNQTARVVCVPYCNQGRHRSVSAYCILHWALTDVFSAKIHSVFFELQE